jgi:hypothetical protein
VKLDLNNVQADSAIQKSQAMHIIALLGPSMKIPGVGKNVVAV